MNYIKEPEGVDFTVIPKHLTKEEAKEVTVFIRKYKREHAHEAVKVVVTPANNQELDFILALLKKMNVQWSLG